MNKYCILSHVLSVGLHDGLPKILVTLSHLRGLALTYRHIAQWFRIQLMQVVMNELT